MGWLGLVRPGLACPGLAWPILACSGEYISIILKQIKMHSSIISNMGLSGLAWPGLSWPGLEVLFFNFSEWARATFCLIVLLV